MAHHSNHLYPERIQNIANWTSCFSHSARVQILEDLAQCHSLSATQLSLNQHLARTTINHHLRKLIKNGAIIVVHNGKISYYKLNKENIPKHYQNLANLNPQPDTIH